MLKQVAELAGQAIDEARAAEEQRTYAHAKTRGRRSHAKPPAGLRTQHQRWLAIRVDAVLGLMFLAVLWTLFSPASAPAVAISVALIGLAGAGVRAVATADSKRTRR